MPPTARRHFALRIAIFPFTILSFVQIACRSRGYIEKHGIAHWHIAS
jgi:hypothetical protein